MVKGCRYECYPLNKTLYNIDEALDEFYTNPLCINIAIITDDGWICGYFRECADRLNKGCFHTYKTKNLYTDKITRVRLKANVLNRDSCIYKNREVFLKNKENLMQSLKDNKPLIDNDIKLYNDYLNFINKTILEPYINDTDC